MSFHVKSHDYVSCGTFISPRPFYMRDITQNDIETCCCKEHLHGRWSVAARIECSGKNSITLEFNNYDGFFSYITKDCQTPPTIYINWDYTPIKKDCFPDIQQNHQQVTIQSGIVKQGNEKSYHPYLSNDPVHDHVFVKCVDPNAE